MIKLLFIIVIMNFIYANNENNKFLVLDSQTYAKIKILNILEGGIVKQNLISSSKLMKDDIIKFYPEYYLYNAKKCYLINDLVIGKKDNQVKIKKLTNKINIKKEVKKIKLLQMLSDNSSNAIVLKNISPKMIKSIGYICANKLVFKNKYYDIENKIGNYIIKTINTKNNTIRLEVK